MLRVDLKNTHYKKEMFYNCVVIDHFTIHTSTDDVVYLKLIYVNYTSIKTNKPNLAAATWFLYMNRLKLGNLTKRLICPGITSTEA